MTPLSNPRPGANSQNAQGIGGVARSSNAAMSVVSVTPSDTVKLAPNVIGLWVGGAGNVAVKMPDGTSATFTAVPAGTLLPISPDLVMSTNTTATLILALY